MSLYSNIAEMLQYISPDFYKQRFFKNLKNLSRENILNRNVEPELLWMKEYLSKNDVYMDIGANVGAYLFQLEKELDPNNIYAFEPNKRLWRRLKRIFPGMQIFPLALSDQNTVAAFKVPVMNGRKIHSRGTLQTGLKEEGESSSEVIQVKVIKLDDWSEINHFSKLNFIKIDVEGNELQTLQGAKETIMKFKPTLMVEMEQRHHKQPIWPYICEISEWGYLPKYLCRKTFELKDVTEETIAGQNAQQEKNRELYVNNIIFIPKR